MDGAKIFSRYLSAILGIAAVIVICVLLRVHLNETAVAFAVALVVILVTALILALMGANQRLRLALEREAEIGFRIQQMLLLDPPPHDVPGIKIAAMSMPSQRIDGDFYIFIRHSAECLDVIVGDVMGKGVPAALVGAATKSHFLRALIELMAASEDGLIPQPKDIVMTAHASLARRLIELDSFVTLIYARFERRQCVAQLVDCGHTGMIRWRAKTKSCEWLRGDNLPLGVRENEIYEQVDAAFDPGDLLLFYSDGITEARAPSGELFGVDRLENFIGSHAGLDPDDLVQAIRTAVAEFSQDERLSDDLTSVALRIEEKTVPLLHSEMEIDSDLKNLHRTREFVREFCRKLPSEWIAGECVGGMELAVNEAASNIMKHAYRGRPHEWIHLEADAYPAEVVMRLTHFGEPFSPAAAEPPRFDGSRESGFGTYIINKCVDQVRYYRDEHGRNCVELKKFRKPVT